MKYIQLKTSDLKKFRGKLLFQQGGVCPILKITLKPEDAVVDHCHKRKDEEIGVNGGGLVRGVIHRACNSVEGKIRNAFIRYGLAKYISLPSFLRHLADYLEQPHSNYIHPSEKPKTKKLGKRLFAKVKKEYSLRYPNRLPLAYPPSGKITKQIEDLIKTFNIS